MEISRLGGVADDSTSSGESGRRDKAETTRAAIAQAEQELFLERGFEKTTMRAVAERAGVSLGNAYYYFSSKEHLVQAFYDQIQREHQLALTPKLKSVDGFAQRYELALTTWVEIAEKYHGFAAKFFKAAAEPTSPLSPFSRESSPSREAAIEIMRTVLRGSKLNCPPSWTRSCPNCCGWRRWGWCCSGSTTRAQGNAAPER